ncbi:MAG: BlaI/MecI/CopY family transcriptional regulator [Yaniella sp.]|nr:BlaI/MecI/CopY family transcriptional regulator [Yaniella sp.]
MATAQKYGAKPAVTPPQEASEDAPKVAQLGELEELVMDLLWQHSPRSVRDILDALPRRLAYTTIATVLQNLKRKDLVTTQREGRLVSYLPLRTREEYTAQLMRQALDHSDDRAASILHFVQDMPEDEVAMLRDYLEQT